MRLDAHDEDPRPTIGELLADPSVRHSLKAVLREWTSRDPVDAAEDAGLLALALERRADETCALGLLLTARHRWTGPDVDGG